MYAATVDVSSNASNRYDVQVSDVMGLNSIIMGMLSDIIAEYMP
jgi:hypothetical protein